MLEGDLHQLGARGHWVSPALMSLDACLAFEKAARGDKKDYYMVVGQNLRYLFGDEKTLAR